MADSAWETAHVKIEERCHREKETGIAISLIHSGKVSYLFNGFGTNYAAIEQHTSFRLASLSKPITAWGVMQLVEQGQIDLDTNIHHYLNRLQPITQIIPPITIRQLLSHTAGLRMKWYFGALGRWADSDVFMKRLNRNIMFTASPGQQFQYTGVGYSILQMLIEDVVEMDFATHMHSAMLEPLGMTQSSFYQKRVNSPNCAIGHLCRKIPMPYLRYADMAAAGLSSSIEDYTAFLQANLDIYAHDRHYEGGVLREQTIRLMHERIRRDIPYGLGFAIHSAQGCKVVSHSGFNLGWQSCFILSPSHEAGIVILVNCSNKTQCMKDILSIWLEEVIHINSNTTLLKKILY